MRTLRLYRYGRFEESKPEMGLTFANGKYNAEWLYNNEGKEYDMYIAFSRQSRYIIDAEKKEFVLKNSWKLGESYGKSDCMFGDNFHINTELTLDSEKLRITTYTYDDFANVVLGVSENCKTIEDAKHYLEEHGLHNSPDSPNLYMSAPVYPDFIHLNVHSHYSIMKSQITIPAAVDKAVADGMKGMALTDLGVMYGIKEFADYCAKINKKRAEEGHEPFKPIIGCEMYVAPRTMYDKEKGDEKCGRLIVLAKNLTGYKNLCKLVSDSWTEGLMDETPRTDHAELEKYKEGLIVIVSGMNSEIANYAIAGDKDKAVSIGEWYKATFGDDFYIGIQRNETLFNSDAPRPHDIEEVRSAYVKIDNEYNIKSVCVNSCNYLNEEDGVVLDHLFAIANNTTLDDAACPRHIEGEWMKTREELTDLFRGRTDARINSLELFDKIEFYSIESFPLLPCFSIPESFGTEEEWRHRYSDEQIRKEFICDEKGNNPLDEYDASKKINQLGGVDELYRIKFQSDYLTKLAYDGAKRIYGTLTPEIEERLRFELHIIKIIGFPSYFLFVQDYVNAAQKELNVWVGPGRGSAVGSLVNYCLGITKIDPLKHGLLFERFLNPDRFSLPDIDLDFDVDGRGKVIQWIKDKYGEDNCANIVTLGTMSARNAIKDVGRIEKLSLEKANALCRAIPDRYYGKNVLKHAITSKDYEGKPENPMLVAALNSNDQKEANTVKYASELEGIVRGTGIHACGLIICPDAIANHVPVAVGEDPDFPEQKTLVTQYDGHFIESTGLVKLDFLGLWTLSEIKECIRLIKQNRGIDVDIDNIPLDDEKTFKLYQEGRTIGTFQFESPGMQKYLQQLQPTTLGDLVALNALYRPGPMDLIPSFIARKNGKQPITYDLPIMEAYLKDTYGITVYQEQIMHLVMAIAGFTRGESDALRKALGRQYYPILKTFKEMFITGGEKNGYNSDILEKTWCNWEMFGKYAFNKAHALAYTWLAYQTAYLKSHYPEEYITSMLLSPRISNSDTLAILRECKSMGIAISIPEINIEKARRECVKTCRDEHDIIFGLKKSENGYIAQKIQDEEEYEFYITDGGFHTTAGHNVCILDSYLIDPLRANGWNYHVSYGGGCFKFEGYSYGVSLQKNGKEIGFSISENSCVSDDLDFHSLFGSLMVSIAKQCETIDDIEQILADRKFPLGYHNKPLEWYKQEAESGNTEVQILLANMYSRGDNVRKDSCKAFEWYSKAAHAGSIEAQKVLGDCYANGDGVEQDMQKAIEWYTKIAESGDKDVALKIANMHLQMSISMYEKAAEAGLEDAQELLADYYFKIKEYAKAGALYKKLNTYGHFNTMIGNCYYELACYSEAVKYFAIAAKKRDVEALVALGKCYYLGQGVAEDWNKANEYFVAAVEARRQNDSLPF